MSGIVDALLILARNIWPVGTGLFTYPRYICPRITMKPEVVSTRRIPDQPLASTNQANATEHKLQSFLHIHFVNLRRIDYFPDGLRWQLYVRNNRQVIDPCAARTKAA